MLRLLPVSLALACAALAACSTPVYFDDPPPRFNTYGRGDNPIPPQYDDRQPPPNVGHREPSGPPIASDVVPDAAPPGSAPRYDSPRLPPPPAPSGALPSGTPVAGKPGFVMSPYAPRAGYVDTRGFSPGEQVKCPYSGKIFLVP